jgi:hypothetical protein
MFKFEIDKPILDILKNGFGGTFWPIDQNFLVFQLFWMEWHKGLANLEEKHVNFEEWALKTIISKLWTDG